MDKYIAELDEANSIAAVWVMKKSGRGPRVFDPKKHIFDPQSPAEFFGAPRKNIVNWLDTAKRRNYFS